MTIEWRPPERFVFQGHSIAWGVMGEGPPAVVLHGTPFSSVEWRRIAPWLAKQRRVHYFDMLGYGWSDKPVRDVSRGIQNELFAALYAHWKVERPDVVAHDFGGSTALRGHLLNGLEFRSLVLIDPVAISPQGSQLVQAAKQNEKVFAELPAYVHEAILRAYINGATYNPLREDEMQAYLRPWLGDEGQKAFWRQVAQMDDKYSEEVEWRYREVRCPVTILWGDNDDWIPVKDGRELARRIPGATFQTVPDAKHLVPEDAPEAIAATVLQFWRSMESG
ncbi:MULTISPECIES: alpha/beta hydrolase [unclassified Mesorhizobium]|uniref:alpha/beta fold hydrolase n=1 Tax=unclassified Mesorhizobium TaxID=325217 RepID=UPI0010937E55|nr:MULTISPECIES: alpha/beta hydrolase [unclassified Mesorhizobium]TGT87327.1 alpha/beta hydrolase [Mesorhizobium sp. M8A.F.Ca.ET.161.01.1.1]TGV41193.1 alpha/beta hydrolase [Mesorhizobium sp. M8A.F.Ca.ET.142.01.1.1]TGW07664.1 alpha/beta hydrolase [Mesorhizobium sp. M2D.F.Ca.ET.145.01.1.1]